MIQIVLKQNKNKDKKGAEGEYIFAKSSIIYHPSRFPRRNRISY